MREFLPSNTVNKSNFISTLMSQKIMTFIFLVLISFNGIFANENNPMADETPPAFVFYNPFTGLPTGAYIVDTLCPGQTIDHCILVESESNNHNIIDVFGNVGTVIITPATTPFDTCFSYTAPAGLEGFDTVTLTVENALGNTATIDVLFLIVNPDTPANAGPNQNLCSMTTANISAVDPDPLSVGTWTVLSGGATITDPTSVTTGVTNLLCGENSFVWTQEYICGATQSDITYIWVFEDNPVAADAGPDVYLCENTYNMLANEQQCSGVGTWDAISGNSTTWNINNPNSLITNIGIGENCFEWHIDNGPCPTGETVDAMCIYVFDSNHPPAAAGPDQEHCTTAFLSAPLSGSLITNPATGHWENLGGVGAGVIDDPLQVNTIVTGMDIGDNGFVWIVDNGPCGITTDTLIITMYDGDLQTTIDAGPDAEYCTPTTTHDMTANTLPYPANGHWELVSGSGVMVDYTNPTETVTNLAIGDNLWAWVGENGPCDDPIITIADTLIITIFNGPQPAANPGPDLEFCIAGLGAIPMTANVANYPAEGTWTLGAQGTASFDDINDPNANVTGLSIGTNILIWTIYNGPCIPSTTTDSLEIIVYPFGSPGAIAGPDMEFCTPTNSYTMEAVYPSFPSTGVWTLISSPGAPAFNAADATTLVSNLPVGISVFRWTVLNGPCASPANFDEMSITIFDDNALDANAGPDQDICSLEIPPLVVTMAGSALTFPQTGEWAIFQGGGTIDTPSSPTTTITNPPVGVNIYVWTTSNGPCGPGGILDLVSDTVIVNVYPYDQADADAGLDQEICSNSSSTVLTANSYTAPTTGQWTVIAGTGLFIDNTDPNTVVTGLDVGINVFRWTINNGPCVPGITTDDVTIDVFNVAQNTVDAGSDQEVCSDINQVTLAGNPPLSPATGEWSVASGQGDFTDVTNPNTVVSNLGLGDNYFVWSITNGPCPDILSDTMLVEVYDVNAPDADAGLDQVLCSDNPATNLTGNLPLYSAFGTWTIISSPNAGIIVMDDDNDPTTGISNLPVGETVFQWEINNSPCLPNTSFDQVSIFVNDITQPDADAGNDQSYCTPISTTTLDGNSIIFPAVGTWEIISTPSALTQITNVNQNNTQITGLVVGETILTWTIDNGACVDPISVDTMSIFIFDENQLAPDCGADQAWCQPPFTEVTLTANSATSPAVGTWVLIEGLPIPTITDIHDPNTTVTGLGVDEYIFEWSIDNGPCIDLPSCQVSVFIYDDTQADANAGPDEELCTPDNSTFLAGNNAISPAIGTWTSLGAALIAPIDLNNPNAEVTGLTVGDNIFVWEIDNNTCAGGITTDTVNVLLFFGPALDANAGPDQEFCTPDNSTFLSANPVVYPATGIWVQTASDGAMATIVDPEDPNTEVTGLAIGNNVFEWTISNGPCGPGGTPYITSDEVIIQIFDGGAPLPDGGPDQELCSPTTTTNMTGVAAVNPGIGTWNLISSPMPAPNIVSINDENTAITNLVIGVHVFTWSLDYATCGTNVDTVVITVFNGPQLPADAGIDQAICLPDNSVVMTANTIAEPGYGTWSILNGGTILPSLINDPNAVIENLPFGENQFVWTVYNGPCLLFPETVDTVSIFVHNNLQLEADAGDDIYLCNNQFSTNLAANEAFYPAFGTWSVIAGTGDFIDINDNTTEVSNFIEGENIYVWTLDNGPCGTTTDTLTIFYAVGQEADAGPNQEFCTPFNCTDLAGNPILGSGEGIWTVISDPTGISFVDPNDENTTVCGMPVGVHVFQWTFPTNACGPASSETMTISVYNQFETVAEGGPDLSICVPDNSVFMEGEIPTYPAEGTWTIHNGAGNGVGTIVSPNSPMSEMTDLEVGENIFIWTVDNGPCGIATDTVSVFMHDDTDIPNAGPDQELCSTTSVATLAGNSFIFPAVGIWTSEGVATIDAGQVNNPNASVSGLVVGENIFTWSIENGPCSNSGNVDQVSIFVYPNEQLDADAGIDQQLCYPGDDLTVMGANEATFPAIGTWTILNSGNMLPSQVNSANALVTDLEVGFNYFVWTIDNGPCASGVTSDTIMIEVFDGNMDVAYAGLDQEICEPQSSVTMDGSEITEPALGTWTQIGGTSVAVFADENNNTTEVSNLLLGVHTFVWTVNNEPCWTTTDTMTVSVFDEFSFDADPGVNQEFCSPTSCATMTASIPGINPDSPAFGTWVVIGIVSDDEPPLSTDLIQIDDINDPETEICGLPVGQTILMWQVYNGECNPPSAAFTSIYINDTNAEDAHAGPDQEVCLPTDTVQMASNTPVYPALGVWTGDNGTIVSINDTNTVVTDLPIGTNTFYWTIDNEPCPNMITTDSMNVLVFNPDFGPVYAGADQEFCTPISSTTLEADELLDPNTGEWSVISGTGSFEDATDPQTIVNGLTVGINCFVWEVYNGPCENSPLYDTICVYIYDEGHPQPDVGEPIELCMDDNFTVVNGNTPTVPAIGTWTFAEGTTGTINDSIDPNTLVSDLEIGFNYLVWNIDNGPCEELIPDTLLITVFTPLADTANAGPDLAICTPESFVIMDAAIPSVPTYGTWIQVEGPSDASVSDFNDPQAEISSLSVGLYVFQWIIYNGPCDVNNSFDYVNIYVHDGSAPPANAGPDMMECLPLAQIQLQATTPVFPAVGTWSYINGSGTIVDGSDPNTSFTDLIADIDSLLWVVDNGPCGTTMDTVVIQLNAIGPDANAGGLMNLCDEFDVELNGNTPLYPASGLWTIFSGDSAINITSPETPNTTVFNFGLDQTVLVWTIDNGACSDLSSDTLIINTADSSVSEADAGPNNVLCGTPESYQFDGSETIGNTASGEWFIVEGGGNIVNTNDEHSLVFDMPFGDNVYLWQVDNGACGISSDTVAIIVHDPEVDSAFAGIDLTICENEFSPFPLGASEYDYPAIGYWEILEGDIELDSNMSYHDNFILELGEIIEPLSTVENVLMWTIDNGPCGITNDTINIPLIDCETLEIPNAFSPNGDGINDVLVIPNLIHFPENSIEIYNRWGVRVFNAAPYIGDWDGRSQEKALFGTVLPVSTYYVVLDLGVEGREPLTGFVYLKR